MLCSLIDNGPQSSQVLTKPVRGHLGVPKLGFGDTFLFVGEGGGENIIEKTGTSEGHETLSIVAPANIDSPLDLEGYPEALLSFS